MLKTKDMVEITEKGPLLDSDGNVATPGYAKKHYLQYDRNAIKASTLRIKEWDYYYIGNRDWGLALTISDISFLGVISASFLDFHKPSQINKTVPTPFPMGNFKMPPSPEIGDVSRKIGKSSLSITNDGERRHLVGKFPDFGPAKEDFEVDITLSEPPEEYMFIATPFHKEKHFYYNAKINCLKAKGYIKLGEKKYSADDALGTLDWGRGVWTYDNTWYWGSLQAVLDNGKTFGFNIGYGFGDTSAASENMLFYDGKAHKLEHVKFNIPGDDEGKPRYLEDWTFTSSDGRLEMDFEPIIDRNASVNIGVLAMLPHQVFGLFSGKAILDSGKVIEFKDLIGFAEKVRNKW